MACASQVDPDYECQLKRRIERKFALFFKPPDVLLSYFFKYDVHLLTERDTDCVKAVTKADGEHDGAMKLLEILCVRKGWFSCLLQVLRDRDVNLSHVADDFEKTKERLDNNREEEEKKWKEKYDELEDQLRLKDQQILELKAGRGKAENADITQEKDRELTGNSAVRELEKVTGTIKAELEKKDQRILELEAERGKAENADHVDITQEEDRELTGNVVRELEKVEHKIKEERKHYKAELEKKEKAERKIKAELEQKDQLISDLTTKSTRQHNEIQSLQQGKNALLDSMQKRVLTKGGSAMQVVFDPSRSEGVTLFNCVMTSWIHKYRPDFASKHGVPRCGVPANLKSAADFVTRCMYVCTLSDEYNLKSGKNQVTTSLQAIQDYVNSLRDDDWSEDNIKRYLLYYVACFFSICYAILTALERHQTTELASFIIYIRDSVSGMLDSFVNELGGWVHISYLLKENNSFRRKAEDWAALV